MRTRRIKEIFKLRELKEKLLLKLSLNTGKVGIALDYVVDETR